MVIAEVRQKMNPVSFFSEHTAEYFLVPDFLQILRPRFQGVAPFYYWSRREGASLSRRSCSGEKLRFAAVFPRRPKVTSVGQDSIDVKFNAVLFETAAVAEPYGVPVFAGVPAVASMMGLRDEVMCLWFAVRPLQHAGDAVCRYLLPSGVAASPQPDSVVGPLSVEGIQETILSRSVPMTWTTMLDTLRHLRYESYGAASGFHFIGGYKPFFVMMGQTPRFCGDGETMR